MLEYRSLEEIINHPGLRIVLIKGMPSPWGQAAKAIFVKRPGIRSGALEKASAEPNDDIVAWGSEARAPIVAWAKEKPIHRSLDRHHNAGRAHDYADGWCLCGVRTAGAATKTGLEFRPIGATQRAEAQSPTAGKGVRG